MDLVKCPSHPLLNLTAPVVFDRMIKQWPASKWTPEDLSEHLGDLKLSFRIGFKLSSDVVWETDCCYEEATISEYLKWLTEETLPDSNPLSPYDRDSTWCYADYKYMSKLFADFPELLESTDWSVFGLNGRKGADSTFWMGSEGAYTPCHYDTYGCNLVAQIYGRKRWILFPPEDTGCLYPTRLPYEESSVFSQVNIKNPDLKQHPKFTHCHPHVVTLEPGQVLFVPRRWWHLVECLENAVSVNSWIEMKDDVEGRFEEAVTRALVTSLIKLDPDSHTGSWVNATEEIPTLEECNVFLEKSWDCLKESSRSQEQVQETSATSVCKDTIAVKRQKLDEKDTKSEDNPQGLDFTKLQLVLNQAGVLVDCLNIEQLFDMFDLSKETLSDHENDACDSNHFHLNPKYLVDCVSHPEVVSLICKIMKENANLK